MARIIAASIDLKKIDKTRIVEGKNGALYYNILISVNDEKDKYEHDVSITEGQTKEERQEKAKKKYIGNGKTIWLSESAPPPKNSRPQDEMPDDLSF